MGSLWRDDEGEKAPPPAASEPASGPQIWRPDEGQPQSEPEDSARSTAPTVELWREDEGVAPAALLSDPSQLEGSPSRGVRPRARVSGYVIAILGLLLLLFVADGVYVVVGMARALDDVEANVAGGRAALEARDLDTARDSFEGAAESAVVADELRRHPSINLASLIPGLDADAQALIALARASRLATTGGLAAVDAAESLGLGDAPFQESIYEGGRVDVQALERAQPFVAQVAEAFEPAAELLEAAPRPKLTPLRRALVRAREAVATATVSAQTGASLMSALPGFLGADGERRYLLLFQALGEARGTGGVVGLYGILRAESGRLSLGKIASYQDIQRRLRGPVPAPENFGRSYDFQSAREQWAQANLTPNFAAAATVMMNMYEAAFDEELDGAIAMDPITLARFMEATGPLTDPLSNEPVTAEEVDELLLRDSYLRFPDPQAQDTFLAGLVRGFWGNIQTGAVGPEASEAISESVRTGHLKIYSATADEQSAMTDLGASGDFTAFGPNVQLAFNENYAVNKVDYYLHRDIDTTVKMQPDGTSRVTTTITVRNLAPEGEASLLLGEGSPTYPPGANRMLQALLVPQGAGMRYIERDGERQPPFIYGDTGYPVGWDVVTVAPGDSDEVTFGYVTDGFRLGDQGIFTLTLVPQTSVNPDSFSFRFVVPEGFRVTDTAEATVETGDAIATGTLTEPRTITIGVERSD